ncbi:MAG: hypothetical protein A2Z72_07815 [Omnitrophica bacterium RBG_13_46_9]|nr:MAG: hypothetical protein A2Z72_07815 [Omnitrophica bacterium RBG_13_46_9]
MELLLFDLDGTLVDSRKDITNAVNATLKKLDFKEKSMQEITSYVGTGVEDLMRKSLGTSDPAILKKALAILEECYRHYLADQSVLYPGVRDVLEYFKAKKKAIVTNRNYEFVGPTLRALKIYDYFEDVIGGDDACCMKPSSCPLDKTIMRFNVAKEKTIIIGDMDIDILAGKKAGIVTCAVTYGLGKKEDIIKAEPEYIIDTIIQLKSIIV